MVFPLFSRIALILALGLAMTIPAAAAEEAGADPAAEAELMEKLAKPGRQHKQLKRLVGEWTVESKGFFADPENPEISDASATFRMLLGGRFVRQTYKGTYQGKPFRGIGVTGYDNGKQKFVGSWMDNYGTGIMRTEGTYDVATHTMTEIGTYEIPTGEMKFKNVTKYIDNDNFLFTMSMVTPAGDQKIMELKYTRKK